MNANPALRRPELLSVGATLAIPRARSPSPISEGRASPRAGRYKAGPRRIETDPPSTTVRVMAGQTLGSIAAQHGVTVDALREINSLRDQDVLYPGESLLVPGKVRRGNFLQRGSQDRFSPSVALARKGVELSKHGARVVRRSASVWTRVARQKVEDAGAALDAGRAQRERLQQPRRYTVRQGDSIVAVAARYRMDERRIQLYNGLRSENLEEGQELFVDPPPLAHRSYRQTEEFACKSDMVADQSHGLRAARRTHRRRLLRTSYDKALGARETKSVAEAAWVAGVGDDSAAAVCSKARRLKLRVKLTGLGTRWTKLRQRQRAIAGKEAAARTRPRLYNPCESGFVSSPFGWRWGRMHEGVDLAAETGTEIRAAQDGFVAFSGWRGGYGKLLEITHTNGYSTRYGHCDSLKAMAGQPVRRGQKVATVGATGACEGPHLHFEVRKNGVPEDPEQLLRL